MMIVFVLLMTLYALLTKAHHTQLLCTKPQASQLAQTPYKTQNIQEMRHFD